ncbi:Amphiphysin [Halotydeus destructor]|nr:Amphiphysin [Halotydeus destructor]
MVINMAETAKTGSFTKAVQKKAGRAKERLLQNLGKADKTTDELFEVYSVNFNKQQTSAARLQKEMKNYVTCLRALQTANKSLMDCMVEVYEPEWPGHEQVPVKAQALEIHWEELCHKLNDQVTIPLSTYLSQFSEIRNKIAKRGRKLVDYDGNRHAVESLQTKSGKKDEIRVAKGREQMEEARRLYEVLNKELHDELPALYDSRIPFLIGTLQTLFSAETQFHQEVSKINSQFSDLVDNLASEAQKGAYHSSVAASSASNQRILGGEVHRDMAATGRPYEDIEYKQQAPHGHLEINRNGGQPEGVSDGRMSPSPSAPEHKKLESGEHVDVIPAGATTTDLPPGVLYKVRATYKYVAEDGDELNFDAAEIIRVVEYEDPEEQEEGWLMGIKESNGQKGLFPANFTRPI